MTTLSTDPFRFLIAPRVLAATLCLPILVVVGAEDTITPPDGSFTGFVPVREGRNRVASAPSTG